MRWRADRRVFSPQCRATSWLFIGCRIAFEDRVPLEGWLAELLLRLPASLPLLAGCIFFFLCRLRLFAVTPCHASLVRVLHAVANLFSVTWGAATRTVCYMRRSCCMADSRGIILLKCASFLKFLITNLSVLLSFKC